MLQPQKTKKTGKNRPTLAKAILATAISLIVLVSLFSGRMGLVGGFFQRVLGSLFGTAAYLLPLLSLGVALAVISGRKVTVEELSGLILVFLMIVIGLQLSNSAAPFYFQGRGGFVGKILALGLVRLFGRIGSWILLIALSSVGLILTNERFFQGLSSLKARWARWRSNWSGRAVKPIFNPARKNELTFHDTNTTEAEPIKTLSPSADKSMAADCQLSIKQKAEPASIGAGQASDNRFSLPPLTILRQPIRLKDRRLEKTINENVKLLEQTLTNFSVQAKVAEVCYGPTITRYEIYPAPGTKVSRVVSLADDIALNLAATAVRIEAPIPGKAAIGIEVPNKKIQPVFLREVIESKNFAQCESPLGVALGKDVSGTPIVTDLTKMPHLLIAGATGSGKSVCINTIISSVLFKATPDQVKLLLIDPKMVELSGFNGIPHLLAPVITDVKKTAGVLTWLVTEMENRYNAFAAAGVRDIERYNKANQETALPYILVVIDELADLMMVSPAEVEEAICRLAQMARATGIHLIMATQRPSVDVITGLIKANIPSRLSFAVSSQTDSRTILDLNGAEKLLGKGDMLFYPVGASKPQRIQGALISDQEVEKLVEFWHNQGTAEFDQSILKVQARAKENALDEVDELFQQVLELAVESGQISASYLQRRFRIGYTRAARIIDQLEAKGYVGPLEGSKPRAVLISKERYEHLLEAENP